MRGVELKISGTVYKVRILALSSLYFIIGSNPHGGRLILTKLNKFLTHVVK